MKKTLRRLAMRTARRLLPAGARNSLRLWALFELPDRRSKPIADFSDSPVLVLAPHMDDEVIGPGGTLALHAKAGGRVCVLLLTDGSLGDPEIGAGDPTPEELARRRRALTETRKKESRAAAQIVGVSEVEFCDAPDGALAETPELVGKVTALLQQQRPRVVYAPALTDSHDDHWAANRILRLALDRLAEPVLDNMIIRGYEIWSTAPANRTADITSVIKLKEQAIAAFVSQTKSTDFAGAMLGLNRYRSMLFSQGRGFAEGFLETTVAEYRELFDTMVLGRHGKRQTARHQVGT